MTVPERFLRLPEGLPVPVDDGAADSLPGLVLPPVPLRSTAGGVVDLAALPGRTAVFCYPRTGRPDRDEAPEVVARWESVPRAPGCTVQARGLAAAHDRFAALGVRVVGLSAQAPEDQSEVVERLHLPHPLLSDAELRFAVGLPRFDFGGDRLIRRTTLVVLDGTVEHVLHPVHPPERSGEAALELLTGSGGPLRAGPG